jgi:CRISPR/Cas system-associated exonuclease Cas4 (RecB family)
VQKIVSFIENKTLQNLDWRRYLGPCARQQLEITVWVFEPIIKRIGFKISTGHYIQYWGRNDRRPLQQEHLQYYPWMIEQFLDKLFDLYDGKTQPIPPNDFKCKHCKTKQFCRTKKGESECQL